MIEIRHNINELVALIRERIFLLPPVNRQDYYFYDNYDVIMVIAGVDRKLNLILSKKSILFV